MPMDARAVIAEDEPLLAQALQAELARAWPTLQVQAVVGDGASAVQRALDLQPDVLFFDIRMPGTSGLEAAADLADAWDARTPFPALVFVTAYDEYAVRAFEARAVDYLLKPVQPERLRKTIGRVQDELRLRRSNAAAATGFDQTLNQLRELLLNAPAGASTMAAPPAAGSVAPLRAIQASVGQSIRMVPVDEVVYFEAADKYVRVLTAEREYLIRTPLKELVPQLDPQVFWQVHRGTVVRVQAIDSVSRDESGRQWLHLRGRSERLAVSRLYGHLFRAM